jgi:hypothetical protein
MREDIHYDDGTYAASGEYEGHVRHCHQQGERGVSHDTPWLGFQGLQEIFLSQVCYYRCISQTFSYVLTFSDIVHCRYKSIHHQGVSGCEHVGS